MSSLYIKCEKCNTKHDVDDISGVLNCPACGSRLPMRVTVHNVNTVALEDYQESK